MLITIVHGRMFRSKWAHIWKITDKIGGLQKDWTFSGWPSKEFSHFMSTYVKENRDEFWAFRKETDWLVILHDGLSPISSHNPWNMCSRDVTWQIKNTIYPLLMFTMFTMPMFTRLTRVVTLQWGGHVGSRDKLNTLYLHLKDTYRHQTR